MSKFLFVFALCFFVIINNFVKEVQDGEARAVKTIRGLFRSGRQSWSRDNLNEFLQKFLEREGSRVLQTILSKSTSLTQILKAGNIQADLPNECGDIPLSGYEPNDNQDVIDLFRDETKEDCIKAIVFEMLLLQGKSGFLRELVQFRYDMSDHMADDMIREFVEDLLARFMNSYHGPSELLRDLIGSRHVIANMARGDILTQSIQVSIFEFLESLDEVLLNEGWRGFAMQSPELTSACENELTDQSVNHNGLKACYEIIFGPLPLDPSSSSILAKPTYRPGPRLQGGRAWFEQRTRCRSNANLCKTDAEKIRYRDHRRGGVRSRGGGRAPRAEYSLRSHYDMNLFTAAFLVVIVLGYALICTAIGNRKCRRGRRETPANWP